MKVIARFFLRAEHWQIFLIVVGMFVGGQIAIALCISPPLHSHGILTKEGFLVGFAIALAMAGFLAWAWSMGSFFNSITNPELRLRTWFFRFAVIYPPVYLVFFLGSFIGNESRLGDLIIPLHLLCMICLFYLLYFVSKSLVLAETDKPASFYDYAGPFFLLWIFPVGIWYVQPRVNRLYAERKNSE